MFCVCDVCVSCLPALRVPSMELSGRAYGTAFVQVSSVTLLASHGRTSRACTSPPIEPELPVSPPVPLALTLPSPSRLCR